MEGQLKDLKEEIEKLKKEDEQVKGQLYQLGQDRMDLLDMDRENKSKFVYKHLLSFIFYLNFNWKFLLVKILKLLHTTKILYRYI